MPCMCGDPYCHSCGPAQGNYRCENCGKWETDGGCDNPQACEDALREMYEKLTVDLREEERLAREFFQK